MQSPLLHLKMLSSSNDYLNFEDSMSFTHIWKCLHLLSCDVKLPEFLLETKSQAPLLCGSVPVTG